MRQANISDLRELTDVTHLVVCIRIKNLELRRVFFCDYISMKIYIIFKFKIYKIHGDTCKIPQSITLTNK